MPNCKKNCPFAILANLIILAYLACICLACDISASKPLFATKPLPYEANALEPIISTRALQLHHGAHYAGYLKTANRLVKKSPFKGQTLAQIIQKGPRDGNDALFNNVARGKFFRQQVPGAGEILDR